MEENLAEREGIPIINISTLISIIYRMNEAVKGGVKPGQWGGAK
jgi:hypothetical protein